ncbi:sodium/glucose cotransporter 4 [Hyalella azteca]|uniref:Sodium/glucose cotransporter 4 n=1 Tax=Hyalella azteca TaxID=294128 RepID=A0A8B7PGN6_HYAAZ|nr:sodium/glucose cotransporter 4 [Hyalella azteca]
MSAKNYLSWPDYGVIIGYFVFVLAVGLVSSRKSKGDVSSFFMASRNMHWIPVGASLFASNVGSGHFIGLAGTGAASGIGIAAFEINATFVLLLLGWLFVPVYMSSGVYTMPEYLRERFGGQRIRIYLSVLALLLYVFTKISADLFAGALFIQEAIGQSSPEWLYFSVLILLAIAAIFTMAGGLTAVMWTDFVQTILMVLGALVLTGIAFSRVGGYEQLVYKYPLALPSKLAFDTNNKTCNAPPPYAFNLMRPIVGSDLPWTGIVFGLTILAIWCWCTDQVIVQRTLASRNIIHAKAGCILGGWLKFLPLWLLVFPGMIARVLFPEEVGCVDPETCKKFCGSAAGCTNKAYVKLVLELLPDGLRGLMLAVMMAALMSSLTSIFNSSSTIFTMDIWACVRRNAWKKRSPRLVEIEQLIVGRISVLVLVIISVVWIPVIQNSTSSQLFVYIQSITSFLAPPLTAVYILAVFWTRTNEPGAFWGLMIGLVVGLLRFVLEFAYVIPPCGSAEPDPRPEIIKRLVGDVHFLHFSILLCVFTAIVTVSVSLLTQPIPDKCLHRLTYWTRFSDVPRVTTREWRDEERLNASHEPAVSYTCSSGEAVKINAKCAENLQGQALPEDTPRWLQVLGRLCGAGAKEAAENGNFPATEAPEKVKNAQQQQIEDALKSIREEPRQKEYVNFAAVLCIVGATFLWGFYA